MEGSIAHSQLGVLLVAYAQGSAACVLRVSLDSDFLHGCLARLPLGCML